VAKISERRTGVDGKGRHGDSAMAAALAFFASRADPGQIAYIPAPSSAKREGFDGRRNPFGAPPMEDDRPMSRTHGF
jgi:phage FluMu gp28-like protein